MDVPSATWESDTTQRFVARRFAHDPTEIARARGMVRTYLNLWGVAVDLPALELVVSELVTNAVIHGQGPVDVRMTYADGRVRLEVEDEGTAGPGPHLNHPTSLGRARPGGWGLRLVDGLSDTWGIGRDGNGTHVWVERRAEG